MHAAKASIESSTSGGIVALGSPIPPLGRRCLQASCAASAACLSTGAVFAWGSVPLSTPPDPTSTLPIPFPPSPAVAMLTWMSMPCSRMQAVNAFIASSGSRDADGAADAPAVAEGWARLTTPPSLLGSAAAGREDGHEGELRRAPRAPGPAWLVESRRVIMDAPRWAGWSRAGRRVSRARDRGWWSRPRAILVPADQSRLKIAFRIL